MKATKKGKGGDDRAKSGRSNSPAKKSKDAAPSATTPAEKQKPKFQIWQEFSETEINNEKWDSAHGGKAKPAEKGKGPASAQLYFDDPDGPLPLPSSLKPVEWKRPADYFGEGKVPVIVDSENGGFFSFDLMRENEHVLHSELIRWIITQIEALFRIQATKATGSEPAEIVVSPDGMVYNYRPWEQIYAINKIGKGPNNPAYNPYGKYVVRLYWLGTWRKIFVDDSLPLDDEGKILLPRTQRPLELWSILLTKALIKVAALDYGGGSGTYEFGDFSPIHCLAGWLPQTITLRREQKDLVWKLFEKLLPEWKLVDPNKEVPSEEEQQDVLQMESEKAAAEAAAIAAGGKDAGKGGKLGEKGKGKEEKKDKDKKGDKAREEQVVYEKPEIVMFGSFYDATRKQPLQVTSLSDMANRSERLRQQGISHMYSHPVLLTQFRACPLEPPKPPEEVPAWKLIRPMVKKVMPTSEEPEVEEDNAEKQIQAVEISSPFVNYKVSPLPIPQSISRPASALSRGSTRSTTPAPIIDEFDEGAPDWDIQEKQRKEQEAEQKRLAEEAALQAQVLAEQQAEVEKKESGEKKNNRKSVVKSPSKEKEGKDRDSKSNLQASTTAMEFEDKREGSEDPRSPHVVIEPEVPKSKWMDLDEFLNCFHCIHVYHKVHTYNYAKTFQDLKNVNKGGAGKDKDGGRKSAASSTTSAYSDERTPLYLYVDSLVPTEVIFCMSALCRWNEPPQPPLSALGGTRSGRETTSRPEGEQPLGDTPEPTDLLSQDTQVSTKPEKEVIVPGSLISEHHSWKSLKVGDAFKRMKTTGVKTVSFHLAAGRQVLKMFMKAPFGYHIQMVSANPFHFGSEEDILPLLSKEPLRVLDYSNRLVHSFGKVVQNFNDLTARTEAENEYLRMHCPFELKTKSEGRKHWDAYKSVFYSMVKDALKTHNPTPEMGFAIKVFNKDATTKNPLGLTFQQKTKKDTPPQAAPVKEKGGKHQQAQEVVQEPDPTEKLEHDPDSWFNREIRPEHLIAVTKLQKCWRGYLSRKVLKASNPEDKYHTKVAEHLSKLWGYMESHAENYGLMLLNAYSKLSPETISKFDFYPDKKHHLIYQDFNGTYPDQPANTWFVVFRDTFTVKEEEGSFMLPKVFSAIPSLCLRIIDNDTNEELPRTMGERNLGRLYKKNEKGYTFIGVARSGDQFLPSGKFKLRIIGNNKPLPEPINDLNSNFNIKEIRDYYVPNKKQVIYRQAVKVLDDHVISLQTKLSKSDAHFELSILDDDKTLMSVRGKGQIIIPAFRFEKDIVPEEDSVTESGRSPSRGSGKNKKRGSSSARSKDGKLSHASSVSSGLHELEHKHHKYIIQATLLDETWPLTAANWSFVELLKAQEKEDLKVVGKPKTPEPETPKPEVTKKETAAKAKPPPKGKDAKGGKADKSKPSDKAADSRPESVTFDEKKAHWILKVISDASVAEEIEIKKDTERMEQIKAMKRAWEEMNPGRAEQAKQCRLRYLNSHLIRNPDAPEESEPVSSALDVSEDDKSAVEPAVAAAAAAAQKLAEESAASLGVMVDEPLLAYPPPQPPPKEILPPLDKTPYLRGDPSKARYVDYATRVQEEDELHQKKLEEFQLFMQDWDARLEAEKKDRNEKKKNHLEFAYKLQNVTDSYREAYFRKREAYRWKLIEEEKKLQEELLSKQQAEMAALAEQEKPKEKGRKGSAKKSPVGSAKKGKKK